MRTVKEVSELTGVSIRALHHYDSIGLLRPTQTTESGYRLYDHKALERLQFILLFRELQFPLKEIKGILDSPNFDCNKALEQQIELLRMRKEHIENLMTFARGIHLMGVTKLDFTAFDTRKIDDYVAQAKATWGTTDEYKEFEEKVKGRSAEENTELSAAMMAIFREFGAARSLSPDSPSVQDLVAKLQHFITDHFYVCTPKILQRLGDMYAGGGSITENIDKAGGEGTADLVAKAITSYCQKG